MRLADVARLSPEARLLYWINERHQVYLRRKYGKPKPWTDDEALRSWFFTNPYRENDKVTVWLRDNVRGPLAEGPEVVFAVLCFRWFNLPATGRLLLDAGLLTAWDTEAAVRLLSGAKAGGRPVFTGAFNISNGGSSKPKINRVCEDYVAASWEALGPGGWMLGDMLGKTTLGHAHGLLGTLPGMGGSGFMAAQVVCDLKYTSVLRAAPDWWTWCSPGPGSRRGLNLVLGRPAEAPTPPNFLQEVNRLRSLVARRLRVPPLHAQDMQSCLCEYSKYERARVEGRSKRRYDGGA